MPELTEDQKKFLKSLGNAGITAYQAGKKFRRMSVCFARASKLCSVDELTNNLTKKPLK